MLSSQAVRGLPRLRAPGTVPCTEKPSGRKDEERFPRVPRVKSGNPPPATYALHDLKDDGGDKPLARVDRSVQPDSPTTSACTTHLRTNHTRS